MSFIFSTVNGSHIGGTRPEVNGGMFYGTAFEQGTRESMLTSLYRMSEYQLTQDVDDFWNPMMKKEDANHWAQQNGISDLKFDKDTPTDEVLLLTRRHIEERDRQLILSSGADGSWGRAAGRFGTQFLGSVLNPLDLPLMFVPVVGNAGKAAQMEGRLGAALTRGMVTEESLAAKGLAMRGYTAAMVEGAVGQAITEIPFMISQQQSGFDYTAEDFATNVAAGAAFGGAIHTLGFALRGAKSLLDRLSPETRKNMGMGAMDDFVRGEDIDPAKYVNLDDDVVANKTLSDTIRKVENADESFKEAYARMSPKHKEVFEFNRGNKLVDENGLPIIVYHGRTWEGDTFDASMLGKNTRAASAGEGFFFAGNVKTSQYYILRSKYQNDPQIAKIFDQMDDISRKIKEKPEAANETLKEQYRQLQQQVSDQLGIDNVFREGGNVGAFMISMKNPMEVDFEGAFHRPQTYYDILKKAKAAGHDGVVIRNTFDGGPLDDIYVAFDSKSIRSAYEYRIARDVNERLKSQKGALNDYKSREELKKRSKESLRQREVADGNTLPVEEVQRHQYTDQPTADDIAGLDEDLEFLRQNVDVSDMDKLTGNVRSNDWVIDTSVERPKMFEKMARFGHEHSMEEWKAFLPDASTWKASDFINAVKADISPAAGEVFDELVALDPTLADIKVSFDRDLLNKMGANGLYKGSQDEIVLNGSVSAKTFFHELVHGSAVRRWREDLHSNNMLNVAINKGENYLAGLKRYALITENEPLKNLVNAYLRAVEFHFNVIDSPTDLRTLVNGRTKDYFASVSEPHYGLFNFDEFIAEALSNRQFQMFLNSIPGKANKTLFREFLDIIRDFFGITKSGRLLDDVLTDFRALTQVGERDSRRFLDHLEKAKSYDVNENMLTKASTCLLNA